MANTQSIETLETTGSGDKALDVAMWVAAIMLWFKTVDVLSYFAPQALSAIFGFDTSYIYGAISATLVEGAALALHFNRRARLSKTAQGVKWVLIAISGICQIFDGFVVTGNVAQMSDTLKIGLQYGVPLVPLLAMVMLAMIGVLPESGTRSHWKGIKNIVRPAWDKFLNGESVGELPETIVLAKDVSQVDSVGKISKTSKRSVGKISKKPNPTQGKDAAEKLS